MTVYLVPEDPAYEVIDFSVTLSETHESTTIPTSFPLETGGTIADHLIHEPQVFSCVVELTESPHLHPINPGVVGIVDAPATTARVVEGVVVPVQTTYRGTGKIDTSRSLVTEMLEKLNAIREAGIELLVITSARQYENMTLVQVGLQREALSLGRGRFALAFQQILTVTSAAVAAPNPAEPRGKALVKKGAQAAELTDAERKARIKSWALKGWDMGIDGLIDAAQKYASPP